MFACEKHELYLTRRPFAVWMYTTWVALLPVCNDTYR